MKYTDEHLLTQLTGWEGQPPPRAPNLYSIDCKALGSLTATPEIMEALKDRATASRVDPRQYSGRMVITMETSDERYAERLNFGVWVGSCYWRGEEIVCE